MDKLELDNWQILIVIHFSFIFSNNERYLSDHYYYLLPGLLGVPKDEILKTQIDIGSILNKNAYCSDPLISVMGEYYENATKINLGDIIFHKSFNHDSFRAFIQSIDDKKSIIEVWTGASAIMGVLSIVIAQYDDLAKAEFENQNSNIIEEKRELLINKIFNLKRLISAWKEHKYISIDIHSDLQLSRETSIRAREIFLAAFQFTIYHELAHHFKGHLKDNNKHTPEKMRQNEFEADIDAINKANSEYNRGPLVCFMASSILQDSSDSLQSNSHPSIIDRTQNYFSTLIELAQDKKRMADMISGSYLPLIRTIFGNLDDRDRFPDWFGYSKKEFEDNISNRHKMTQVFNPQDYFLNDKFNIIDGSKPKAKRKKFAIDFI